MKKELSNYFQSLQPKELRDFLIEAALKTPEKQLMGLLITLGENSQLTGLFETLVKDNTPPTSPLPTKAPALWKNRKTGREVTAVDFVEKHYGEWIGYKNGLTRSLLRKLDMGLYNAYARRIYDHPNEDLGLPTKSDQVDLAAQKLGLMKNGEILIDQNMFRTLKTLVRRLENH